MLDGPVRPADHKGEDDVENVVREYSQAIFRICLMMLGNTHDAEDALQETMLRYMTKGPVTNDESYKKAWLIRVATNVCKNMYFYNKRHNHINLDDCLYLETTEEQTNIIQKVMQLPEKYKTALILFHVEGYKVDEISKILHVSNSAIYKRLHTGRKLLKLEYGKENFL